MGAAFGGAFGTLGTMLVSQGASSVPLYVMLGMVAMMGATLHAPLSGLVAVLELTGDPHVILPGLVAIVTALLVREHVFDCEPIFAMQLRETPAPSPVGPTR